MEQITLYLQSLTIFLIENVTIEIALKIIIAYFFIVWIILVIWVMKDISIRTNSLLFQVFCVLTILILTPFWIFIYLLVRPRRTLYDKYYEEIEENLAIIDELVEERKRQIEEGFKRNKIPRAINDVEKVEVEQKIMVEKIIEVIEEK